MARFINVRPRIEATSALETRLAQVFLSELLDPRVELECIDADDTQVDIILDGDIDDHDDYASYELVVAPVSEFDVTYKFQRVHDTTQDHIVTVELERVDLDTAEVPLVSTPYELIDIQDCSASFELDIVIEDEPREAPPAGLNVRTQAWFAAEPTDIIEPDEYFEPPSSSSSRQLAIFVLLVGALALGLSIALFVI